MCLYSVCRLSLSCALASATIGLPIPKYCPNCCFLVPKLTRINLSGPEPLETLFLAETCLTLDCLARYLRRHKTSSLQAMLNMQLVMVKELWATRLSQYPLTQHGYLKKISEITFAKITTFTRNSWTVSLFPGVLRAQNPLKLAKFLRNDFRNYFVSEGRLLNVKSLRSRSWKCRLRLQSLSSPKLEHPSVGLPNKLKSVMENRYWCEHPISRHMCRAVFAAHTWSKACQILSQGWWVSGDSTLPPQLSRELSWDESCLSCQFTGRCWLGGENPLAHSSRLRTKLGESKQSCKRYPTPFRRLRVEKPTQQVWRPGTSATPHCFLRVAMARRHPLSTPKLAISHCRGPIARNFRSKNCDRYRNCQWY